MSENSEKLRLLALAGNAERYSAERVAPLENSPLTGMNICYLGSSVTYGSASLQTTFAEYIAKRNQTTFVKEAVSGTTLVTSGGGSYVARMKKIDRNTKFDLFVCQLSTNDAAQNKPLGTADGRDTETVCGAINAIVDYAEATWRCPVIFYTNAYYANANYAAMVAALKTIAEKRGIGLIDLYSDRAFNAISEEKRALYMADEIHPTEAGYLEWWTPKFEEYLYAFVRKVKGG